MAAPVAPIVGPARLPRGPLTADIEASNTVIEVVEEPIHVEKRLVETGRARVHVTVEEHDEPIEALPMRQDLVIERIPVGTLLVLFWSPLRPGVGSGDPTVLLVRDYAPGYLACVLGCGVEGHRGHQTRGHSTPWYDRHPPPPLPPIGRRHPHRPPHATLAARDRVDAREVARRQACSRGADRHPVPSRCLDCGSAAQRKRRTSPAPARSIQRTSCAATPAGSVVHDAAHAGRRRAAG